MSKKQNPLGRFKIDFARFSNGRPFALYHWERSWIGIFGDTYGWAEVASFKTIEEATEFYDNVKNLPEYLA